MELLFSKSMSCSKFELDVDSSILMAVTIFTKITSIANMKNKNMQMAKFVYCEYVKMKLLFCWWWWKMLLLWRFEAISLIFGSTTLTNDCTGPIKRNKRCAIFHAIIKKANDKIHSLPLSRLTENRFDYAVFGLIRISALTQTFTHNAIYLNGFLLLLSLVFFSVWNAITATVNATIYIKLQFFRGGLTRYLDAEQKSWTLFTEIFNRMVWKELYTIFR